MAGLCEAIAYTQLTLRLRAAADDRAHGSPYTRRRNATERKEPTIAASRTPSPSRDPRIEALRLVAAACIAVFHTFMPWFAEMCGCYGDGRFLMDNAAGAAVLGFVNLLGAFGNNIFFLISGMFLVPAAARASRESGYWRAQGKKAVRRAKPLLATVVFYMVVVLALSATVLPIEGVSAGELPTLATWLEFIWVYLAVIVLSPAIGWVWERLPRRGLAVAALIAVVFALNAHIAFVDPGDSDRGLLDWRKLMSAITYATAFVTGGALARVRLSRAQGAAALAAAVGASLAVEAWLACTGQGAAMAASSYKSTSALSFSMAAAAVLFARSGSGGIAAEGRGAGAGKRGSSAAAAFTRRAAASVLGFYILQSLTSPLWQQWFYDRLWLVYSETGFSPWPLIAAGTALSLALLAALLTVDQLVRPPLFRRLGLTK